MTLTLPGCDLTPTVDVYQTLMGWRAAGTSEQWTGTYTRIDGGLLAALAWQAIYLAGSGRHEITITAEDAAALIAANEETPMAD